MFFNNEQIQEILSLVDFRFADLVWRIFGPDHLTSSDVDILKKYGVNVSALKEVIPPYWQNWMFGLLTGMLSDSEAGKITYDNFVKYLNRKQYMPPSSREVEEYEMACNRTYGYLKGLGDKTKKDITSYISDAELRVRAEYEGVISESMKRGVVGRKTTQLIASDISNRLNDWSRDWNRIVETEYQAVFNMGRVQSMARRNPGKKYDTKVYFDVFPGACSSCIKLYLTSGIGSEPKIFTIKELIGNGTNIGRKRKDWKPTVLFPVHPYCRCLVREYFEGDQWDPKKRAFVIPENYERKFRPDLKVKITVGDQIVYA